MTRPVVRSRAGRWRYLAVTPVVLLAGCWSPAATSAPEAASAASDRPAAPSAAPGTPAVPCVAVATSRPGPRPDPALPDLALPCFDGSATVHLGQVTGPAIVNLWASWCPPCRAELPAVQRYAVRAAGRVAVLGVDTMDTRRGGGAIIEDFGLTFPVLVDEPGALLQRAAPRPLLPVTLFVDRDGRVAYTYQGPALDDARLAELVQRYLAVVIPS